jgi:hypothetical protein
MEDGKRKSNRVRKSRETMERDRRGEDVKIITRM